MDLELFKNDIEQIRTSSSILYNIEEIPKISACYVLLDLDNAPIYVGKSELRGKEQGVYRRIKRHLTRSDIVASRQLDLFELRGVLIYPSKNDTIDILESYLHSIYDNEFLINEDVLLNKNPIYVPKAKHIDFLTFERIEQRKQRRVDEMVSNIREMARFIRDSGGSIQHKMHLNKVLDQKLVRLETIIHNKSVKTYDQFIFDNPQIIDENDAIELDTCLWEWD